MEVLIRRNKHMRNSSYSLSTKIAVSMSLAVQIHQSEQLISTAPFIIDLMQQLLARMSRTKGSAFPQELINKPFTKLPSSQRPPTKPKDSPNPQLKTHLFKRHRSNLPELTAKINVDSNCLINSNRFP